MAGIAYIEILLAILLITITLVPALEALQPGVDGAGIHEDRLADHYQLTGRLEELLAESYGDLDEAATAAGDRFTPTTYSDIVTQPDGRQLTRNVFLSRYDIDNADADNDPFTGIDEGLLWVRVEFAGTADGMETLVGE
jgi:type II secretory pathway pseudopilin PulG